MKAAFAVNLYDSEGDSYDDCILLFAGEDTVLRFKSVDELIKFGEAIVGMRGEVSDAVREAMA